MPPPTRQITFEELSKYFHLPVRQAAKNLNICSTILKRVSRSYGMERWPFRKLKSIDEQLAKVKSLVGKTDNEKREQEEETKRLIFKKQSIMKKPKILFQSSRISKGDDKTKYYNTPLYATTNNTFYFHLNPSRHTNSGPTANNDDLNKTISTFTPKSTIIIPKTQSLIQPQACAVYSLLHVGSSNKSLVSTYICPENIKDSSVTSMSLGLPYTEATNFRTEIQPMEPHLILNNLNTFEDIVAASRKQFIMFGSGSNSPMEMDRASLKWQTPAIFQIS